MSRFLEEAKKLIKIGSTASTGNESVVNHLTMLMQNLSFKVSTQHVLHSRDDFSRRQFNIIGIFGDPLVDRKVRTGLLLLSHLDTAEPGRTELWTESGGDPYDLQVKDGKMYGLGAVDSKMDFLCKLFAVNKFRNKKLKMPIYLVGTSAEKIGMLGSKYLIESYALNPQYVLVGKPTGNQLVSKNSAQILIKVSLNYQVVERGARGFNRKLVLYSKGRTSHTALQSRGLNAIDQLIDFISLTCESGFEIQFTRIEGGKNPSQVPDLAEAEMYLTSHHLEDFKRFFRETSQVSGREDSFRIELGGVGDRGICFLPPELFHCMSNAALATKKYLRDIHPGIFVSLGSVRQSLGRTEVYFDCRVPSEADPLEIFKEFRDKFQALISQYPSMNITVDTERSVPPLHLEESEWLKVCQSVLQEMDMTSESKKALFSSEAGLYSQAGFETLVFGPGNFEEASYSPHEGIELKEVQRASAFYEKLIQKVCV